jgi:hypothetical protein
MTKWIACLPLVAVACMQPVPGAGMQPQPVAPPGPSGPRSVAFNGRPLDAAGLSTLAALEQRYNQRVPDGSYWYDPVSGAAGVWNGPMIALLPAGLTLGGPLPAEASGGGHGRLTGVFINGRELHPVDVQNLRASLGQVWPGRWRVDAHGNAGPENGPPVMNLYVIAQQRRAAGGRGGADPYYRSDRPGESTFITQGCAAVSGSLGSGGDKRDYSYYVGCD